MQHEAQAVASHCRGTKTDGPRNLLTRPWLGEIDLGVTELPILVPSEEAAALEAAAHERGLTVAQLARLLIRQFLDRASGSGAPAAGSLAPCPLLGEKLPVAAVAGQSNRERLAATRPAPDGFCLRGRNAE